MRTTIVGLAGVAAVLAVSAAHAQQAIKIESVKDPVKARAAK